MLLAPVTSGGAPPRARGVGGRGGVTMELSPCLTNWTSVMMALVATDARCSGLRALTVGGKQL